MDEGNGELLQIKAVRLSSGRNSFFKIDAETLSDAVLQAAAHMLWELLPPFGEVIGVPRGGLRLADQMRRFRDVSGGPLLIVDDVLTTGASMEAHRLAHPHSMGAVLFARGSCPDWVTALFTLHPNLHGR